MKQISIYVFTIVVTALSLGSGSAQIIENNGSDTYLRGFDASLSTDIPRDVFATGFSVSVDGNVAGDAHVSGFNIEIDGDIGADLYAAGSNITIDGTIAEDLTAAGFVVDIDDSSSIGGNARIAAGTIKLDGPINGSLVAAGGNIKIDAVVQGDVQLIAGNISFGSNAKILGKLIYTTPEKMEIPETVVPPTQVEYKPYTEPGLVSEVSSRFDDGSFHFWPSFLSVLAFFIITLAFLLVVFAILLAFMGERVERLRQRANTHTGTSMLFGFLGLATLIGLVPVSLMTIVGIPLVPVVILMIVVMWIAGYLIGIYTVSWRAISAFWQPSESNAGRLSVIAVGLICFSILNFIPFVGPLVNFLLVLLGLGAIVVSAIIYMMTMEIFSSLPDVEIASAPTNKKS